jgi:hypothetical protein
MRDALQRGSSATTSPPTQGRANQPARMRVVNGVSVHGQSGIRRSGQRNMVRPTTSSTAPTTPITQRTGRGTMMSLLLGVWGSVDRFRSHKSGTKNGVRMYSTVQI